MKNANLNLTQDLRNAAEKSHDPNERSESFSTVDSGLELGRFISLLTRLRVTRMIEHLICWKHSANFEGATNFRDRQENSW